MLKLRLLGGLALEVDGEPAPAPGGRCGSLLAWLALHEGMQPRARVAARLWPEVLDESARRSLRTALLDLRRDLGAAGEHLLATRDEVGLGPPGEIWVDVRAFTRAVEEGRLTDALDLGEGELLPEFEHEWVYAARDEHRHAYEQVVERLAADAEAAGDLTGAVEHTRRLVAMDPLAEGPARALIRRLAATDDRAAALAAYDRHRERLRTDLGMAPSAATRALADEVRADQTPAAPQHVELPAPLGHHAAKPLFGRTTERAVLRDHWRAALQHRSLRCVVVGGEPGIGKTRLLADLCAAAQRDGAVVLYGRCHEDAPFPYAPIAEALRRYADAVGPSRVSADAGPGAAQLARIVPQIEPEVAADAEADDEALRLLDAIVSVIAGAGRAHAVVLALEDVHWADRPTLRVLEHLTYTPDEAPVLVVATYRDTEATDDDPLTATLARLRRGRHAEILRVGALETPALVELARASWSATPDRLLDEVIARTDGNPYFVEEVLRDLAVAGAVRLQDIGVPETVEDLIARRLGRLSGEARTVLNAAAVIGTEFDIDVLELATERPRDVLLDALDDALASGLIHEQAAGRFSFAHALARETLYQRLSGTRRADLHGRVGRAIAQRHGDAADHLPALARHHDLAGDWADALRYHLLAGDAAASIHGADDALRHYTRAIELAGALSLGPDDARVYGAHHRRALLRQRAGDLAGAVEDADAALAGARAAGDAAAELAALNRRGFMRRFQRVEDAVASHEEALRAAQGSGDVREQAATLARLAIAQSSLLRFDEATRLAEEARAVAEGAGDDEALALALDAVKLTALQLGDLTTLDDATSRLLDLRERAGDAWSLHWLDDWVLLERAFIAIATADWEAALAGVASALDANRRLRDRFAEPIFLDALTWIHRSRGDHEAAIAQGAEAAALAREVASPEWVAATSASLGWALLEAGDPTGAAAHLEPALAAAERVGARAQVLRCTALLSWAALDLGDQERATGLADEAEKLLATVTAPPGRMFLLGAHAPLAVARVRLGCGEATRAIALVEPVLEAARAAGWSETVAYATLLLGAARGDRATVEQARALARRDGLGWVARDAEGYLRRQVAS
ncbi:MAG TPA: AAA family ATPase [Solirubrobacteraceae bacterium]